MLNERMINGKLYSTREFEVKIYRADNRVPELQIRPTRMEIELLNVNIDDFKYFYLLSANNRRIQIDNKKFYVVAEVETDVLESCEYNFRVTLIEL